MTDYVGIPAFLVIYFGHRIYYWSEKWMYSPEEIDLMTGLDTVIAAENPVSANRTTRDSLREFFT